MNSRNLLATVAMCFIASHAFAASEQNKPSAESLLISIHNEGAKRVLWRLYEDEETFNYVLDRIESGNRLWFVVASELYRVCDAGACSMLMEAIPDALLKSPEVGLSLLGQDIDLPNDEGFCSGLTGLERPEGNLKYLRSLERALLSLKHTAFPERQRICLAQVRRLITAEKGRP